MVKNMAYERWECSKCGKINRSSIHNCPQCAINEARKPHQTEQAKGSTELALLNARKIKAFVWLEENTDELSIEWTGSHNHIYQGNAENLERLGVGRTLLEAVEMAMGI